MSSKLVIIQTVIPDYRANLFFQLKAELGDSFILFGGKKYFEKSVQSDSRIQIYKKVRNFYLFNRKLLFQFGFWKYLFLDNVMVLELNPRIVSTWIVLILRKFLKKRTILWGHAWSRSGQHSKTEWLRGTMRKLASGIIVYTNTQKAELKRKMPNKFIAHAPNSIYFKSQMNTEVNKDSSPINIIYVGRLTESKKPILLVKAFNTILNKLPSNTKLIIVGDGDQHKVLENYIKQNNLHKRVFLLGHLNDYQKLKKFYETSLLSVSPGYVGLSITQSFSFGVPMIISKTEPHSPEIEAVKENINAVFFETDNYKNLGECIIQIFNNADKWINKRQEIVQFCKDTYSIEQMVKPFLSLLINE